VGKKKIKASRGRREAGAGKSSAFAQSPIEVSTPPVRIIGSDRRHKGGFRLSDR